MDEADIIKEEHLMSDSQFSGSGAEAGEPGHSRILLRQKRQNLNDIDELGVKDGGESVAYIETAETDPDDPLTLEQICVPVDGANVSWIGLSS